MKKALNVLIALASFALIQTLGAEPVSFEVTADDTMRFNVATLEAQAGQEITLTLKNIGKLPKAAMGHNFVVLAQGSDIGAFANVAVTAADNDYIPTDEEMSKKVVAHTKLLGPGESDTITFTLEEAGSYPFLCSFPGHWALMKGTIEVK